MIEGLEDIKPNIKKSNLNVKHHRQSIKKKSAEASKRKLKEKAVTKDADIVFGLDNGATRNNILHHYIS